MKKGIYKRNILFLHLTFLFFCFIICSRGVCDVVFQIQPIAGGIQGNFPYKPVKWYLIEGGEFIIGPHPFMFGSQAISVRFDDKPILEALPLYFQWIILGEKYRHIFPLYTYVKGNAWLCNVLDIKNNKEIKMQYVDFGLAIDLGFPAGKSRPKIWYGIFRIRTGAFFAHINNPSPLGVKYIAIGYAQACLSFRIWRNWAQTRKKIQSTEEKEPDWGK